MTYDLWILYSCGKGLETVTAYEVSKDEAERIYGDIAGDILSFEMVLSDLLGVKTHVKRDRSSSNI